MNSDALILIDKKISPKFEPKSLQVRFFWVDKKGRILFCTDSSPSRAGREVLLLRPLKSSFQYTINPN